MAQNYTRDHLKISVGKILQTLGWNSINSTPLAILTDILGQYMAQIAKSTNNYANEFGCTQPNLDHLGLTFRDVGVNIAELEEYVKYVNFGPSPTPAPKYPVPKEDHLNFLKPGSKEVVTRPVHIHEHLPPMNPLLEGSKGDVETVNCNIEEPEESNSDSPIFKKPADIPADFKRPSLRREEEGSRPTREISSVMMTTSGYLSPAREGKLPEARTPVSSLDPMAPTNNSSETLDMNKKNTKVVKKVEKKKARPTPYPDPNLLNEKKKRMNSIKWALPSKQHNKINNKVLNQIAQNHELNITATPGVNKTNNNSKMNKALAAARLKTEKLNTTITPIPMGPVSPQVMPHEGDNVDKLFTEPDKKKVNIFKKISNVRNEKSEPKGKREDFVKQESRESSPDLIIDEPEEIVSKLSHLPNDVTIEPISSVVSHKSPEKIDTPYFDDDSQPGTPSTPKTPEMISHSPPQVKEKRKRKDSRKVKKIQKQSPHRLENEVIDLDMERPKTPEAQVLPKMEIPILPPIPTPSGHGSFTFPGPFHFGGPGLIPAPLSNTLFPPIFPNFSQKPCIPTPKPQLSDVPISPNLLHMSDVFNKNSIEKLPMSDFDPSSSPSSKSEKKNKDHKKDKKDKLKKRNKKDKIKNKAEKKKLREEKKEKIKKEKKEKRKEKEAKDGDAQGLKMTLKIKSPSPRPETPETRKLNIKPIVKSEESNEVSSMDERIKRETSPGLAKISALVFGPPKPKSVSSTPVVQPAEESVQEEIPITPAPRTGPGPGRPRIHPIKPKPSKPKKRRTSVKKDADGNEVWICPACGRQDDGSPMIGCDGCDAWYHWVCVGIQVPPDDSEDWYCRHCLLKKDEDLQSDKQKKKRKKREKKEH